jgi:hypothetical protein
MLRVGLILPIGFHVMSYATLATFDTANFIAGEQFYGVSIHSEHGGPVPNSFGTATETEPLEIRPFDTLLVGAGMVPTPPTPKLNPFSRPCWTMRSVSARPVLEFCFDLKMALGALRQCSEYRQLLPSSGNADRNDRGRELLSAASSKRGRRFTSSMSRLNRPTFLPRRAGGGRSSNDSENSKTNSRHHLRYG